MLEIGWGVRAAGLMSSLAKSPQGATKEQSVTAPGNALGAGETALGRTYPCEPERRVRAAGRR